MLDHRVDKNWRRADWKDDLKKANNENKKPNYEPLLETVKEAVSQAKAMFHTDRVEYDGLLWVQSERDDTSPETAAMYEANLRALIRNIREDLKVPDLPFLFADANVRLYVDVLRGGMKKVVREVPNTRCIPIDDLPRNGGVHYNTQGQIMLGKRFAEVYLDVTRKPA